MKRKVPHAICAAMTCLALSPNALAKPRVAPSTSLPAHFFLGAWSNHLATPGGFPMKEYPRPITRRTIFEFLPNGLCRITEVEGKSKTVTRGTYRVAGNRLVTTHTIKNTRPPGFARGQNYVATVRTFFRFSRINVLRNDRIVRRYVNARDQSVIRLDWERGVVYRKVKPTISSSFQLL